MEIHKVNFFLRGEEFLSQSRRVEDLLNMLGRVAHEGASRGIAQFTLYTHYGGEDVRMALATLNVDGELYVEGKQINTNTQGKYHEKHLVAAQ